MSKPINYQTPTKIKEMELNIIKKALYKEKPIAKLVNSGNHFYKYIVQTSLGEVEFHVPLLDLPLEIKDEENAQLLIRWIVL